MATVRVVEGVTVPARLVAYDNGLLPSSELVEIGYRRFVGLRELAAAFQAVVAAAWADNVRLACTDAYRTLSAQIEALHDRYTLTRIPGAPTRRWDGQTWYRKPGEASVAPPGDSVHGWGLAVDFSMSPAAPGGREAPLTPVAMAWLRAHGPSFGMAASVRGEPWHWVLRDWMRYQPKPPRPTPNPPPAPVPTPVPPPPTTPTPPLEDTEMTPFLAEIVDMLDPHQQWIVYPAIGSRRWVSGDALGGDAAYAELVGLLGAARKMHRSALEMLAPTIVPGTATPR